MDAITVMWAFGSLRLIDWIKIKLTRKSPILSVLKKIYFKKSSYYGFGWSHNFDKQGNITIGIRETESIFPELEGTVVDKLHGLSITIVTSANSKEAAKILLSEMGFPFRNK